MTVWGREASVEVWGRPLPACSPLSAVIERALRCHSGSATHRSASYPDRPSAARWRGRPPGMRSPASAADASLAVHTGALMPARCDNGPSSHGSAVGRVDQTITTLAEVANWRTPRLFPSSSLGEKDWRRKLEAEPTCPIRGACRQGHAPRPLNCLAFAAIATPLSLEHIWRKLQERQ